ncbi:uncharacterized protein LOC118749656 [Rhagoletis pomonella]|uniref:uncharacterized protein LOC118749656 n=1 Tax=Rhagoletis pomonella TaxID=28610 RepID=UPI001785EF82|nr:uncharacterized protein LOC118749656 [Rhagoletis pomonella]
MKLPVSSWDAIMVPIVLSKIPTTVQRHWNLSLSTSEIPNLEELLKFLERRAHRLACDSVAAIVPRKIGTALPDGRKGNRSLQTHLAKAGEGTCVKCVGEHRIMRCRALLELGPEERFKALKATDLCFNCLKRGHMTRQCPSGGCKRCGRRHNTLFCREDPSNSSVGAPKRDSLKGKPLVSCLTYGHPTVLLATVCAYAIGDSHQRRLARILCDPGSQASFITERLANQLQLRRFRHNVAVEGIGASNHTRTSGSAQLTLKSHLSNFAINLNVLIIPSITSPTPGVHIVTSGWTHLHGLPLSDPHFGTPAPVDILLGADVWDIIVEAGIISGKANQPHARSTRFGWVVFGPATEANLTESPFQSLHAQIDESETPLDELVHKFWQWEELPSLAHSVNTSECERIFAATHSRNSEGRYVVHLPFRSTLASLGDSHTYALQQFLRIEKILASNEDLRSKYVDFMREYSALAHMEPVTTHPSTAYYIPHYAVLGKFRGVFNASARTSSGVSLNDIQMVGPQIQEPLLNILFRFRRHRVALTADIEKIFRQVLVTAPHRNYQRILWRERPVEPIGIYQLTTVTYGMACSPFNALRALHQCANDNQALVVDPRRAAEAQNIILSSFYVDDFL